jgi:hypothetical protein
VRSGAARRLDVLAAWLERRPVMAVISLTIMTFVVAAGTEVMPPRLLPSTHEGVAFHASHDVGQWAGRAGNVYLVGSDLFPYQCGTAEIESPFAVHLTPYFERGCRQRMESLVVRLYEADLRVPWALIPEADRAQLKSFGRRLMTFLRNSAVTATNSPIFEREYRPILADMIRAALRTAWTAPATQAAFSHATGTLEPELVDRLVDGIAPIVVAKAESSLWQSLRDYANTLMGGKTEDKDTPLSRGLRDLLRDETVQAHLMDTLPALASSGAMTGFASTLASEMGMALLNDPRLLPFASRLFTDSRLFEAGTVPSPFSGRTLTHDLPQWLMRLRHERDHNPLVSRVIKDLVRGRPGFVVLLMTAAQRDALSQGDLPAGIELTRGSE